MVRTHARRRIDGRTQENLRKANQPLAALIVDLWFLSLSLFLSAFRGRRRAAPGEFRGWKNRRAEPTIASPRRTQRYRHHAAAAVLCG